MGSFRTGGAYAPSDPALVAVIEEAARRSPYDVVMFSGDRDGSGGSQHDNANAVDIVLIDPSTGQRVPNLGAGGEAFRIYEAFAQTARQVQQEIAPQLTDTFRWGGYFGPSSLNPTGADLMHLDLGSSSNMRMGSWEGGLNAEGQRFVANLGPGRIYSDVGRQNADGTTAYANLWGRAPLTGPTPPAAGGSAGGGGPMGYAGAPPPLTGAAAAAAVMGAGGTADGGLPTIRNGAGNRSQPDENVRALQAFLNANGQNLAVDGIFGDMTERAVRAYQQANGLEVDGIVGPETWGHIAGAAAAAAPGGATESALPGPVRGFVRRLFGAEGEANLAQRVDAFRRGISKGLSPTDAFTQARGQPITGTPVAGSAIAGLPPKSAPAPQANPARVPSPVVPQQPAAPSTAAPAAPAPAAPTAPAAATAAPMQPTRPAVAGDGMIQRPVPKPVVGDGLVNRPYTQPTGAATPKPVVGDGLVNRPSPAGPVVGDGLIARGPDPGSMMRGRPESSVPTTPAANIGEGEYLPNEWTVLQQFERNGAQNPTYAAPPGARPAPLIPNAPARGDAYSLKPLRETQGPTQSGAPIFDPYPSKLGNTLSMPQGDLPPIQPVTQPAQGMFEFPQAAGARKAAAGVNPAGVVASMPYVSIPPPAGWGPQNVAADLASKVNPAAVVASMQPVDVGAEWVNPYDLARPDPAYVDLRAPKPAPAPVIPDRTQSALVPMTKDAPAASKPASAPAAPVKTQAPPPEKLPPKPVIPREDPKKKAA